MPTQKTQKVKLKEVKPNPNNPRLIKDEKFRQLVKSISEFPEMLELRPIVVDESMTVLGGNMRLKAIEEVGLKEITIVKVEGLTEEQKKEFVIKDNLGYGEWDWDIIANEWNVEQISDWGLDIPKYLDSVNLDGFFDSNGEEKKSSTSITLTFTEEEYTEVLEAFERHGGSKEQTVYKLLVG